MADSEALVRVRTQEDIPGCAKVLREVYEVDGYPVEGVEDAEGWLFPDGLIEAWVAGPSDGILGHALASEPRGEAAVEMFVERTGLDESKVAVLARLFVAPAARGRSLGQELAGAAMRYTQSHGRRAVFDVMAKDRAAIRLYERVGCVRLGTTMHTFGDGQQVPAYCYAAPGALDPA